MVCVDEAPVHRVAIAHCGLAELGPGRIVLRGSMCPVDAVRADTCEHIARCGRCGSGYGCGAQRSAPYSPSSDFIAYLKKSFHMPLSLSHSLSNSYDHNNAHSYSRVPRINYNNSHGRV